MKNLIDYIDEGNNTRYENSIEIFNTSDAIAFWYETGENGKMGSVKVEQLTSEGNNANLSKYIEDQQDSKAYNKLRTGESFVTKNGIVIMAV